MLTEDDGEWGDPWWREELPIGPRRAPVDWNRIWSYLATWLAIAVLLWTAIMLIWHGLP